MSPDPIPIYTGNDFYIPAFEVVLGDRKQSGELLRDVMQVTYEDNVDAIDSFELTVNNWDADARKFKYHDKPTFEPGKPLILSMGYLGSGASGLRTMIRGVITELRPTFPSSGPPTLGVKGQHVLGTLQKDPNSAKFELMTYTQIAQRVCGNAPFPFRFQGPQVAVTEAVQANVIQDKETDLAFLKRLAQLAGYEFVADDAADDNQTVLRFGPPPPSTAPTYKMQYGRSLIEFQPTLAFNRQVSKVEVRGWDPVKGQKIQVTVDQGDLGQNGLNGKIKPGSKNPVEDRTEVLTSPVRDEAAAREAGLGYLRRINDVLVTASGSVVGLPDLHAGRQVEISGLGLRFNGRYFLTKTTHRLSNSGYITQFECRLQLLSNVSGGEAL